MQIDKSEFYLYGQRETSLSQRIEMMPTKVVKPLQHLSFVFGTHSNYAKDMVNEGPLKPMQEKGKIFKKKHQQTSIST